VFKVFSFGLHEGPESFSPLSKICVVDKRLFNVSPQRPHVYCRCHGYCRWFSTALNMVQVCKCIRTYEVQLSPSKINFLSKSSFFVWALPESHRGPVFMDSRCIPYSIHMLFRLMSEDHTEACLLMAGHSSCCRQVTTDYLASWHQHLWLTIHPAGRQ